MHTSHHEEVLSATVTGGVRCHIAVHSTARGPALGGVRVLSYPDDGAALRDALNLSEAMTYKSAVADLPVGGGKAVVNAPPAGRTPELFHALGRLINRLDGRFVAACDMNVTPEDLRAARRVSPWVRGLPRGDGGSGDSSEMTAYGVFLGIRAGIAHLTGSSNLAGCRVGIDGAGKVGARLAVLLRGAGAVIVVSDIDTEAAERTARHCQGDIVDRDELYRLPLDVLSPNSVGGTLTTENAERVRCRLIAGAANNQLDTPAVAERLGRRGILYAPDFVINAGGLIQVVDELHVDGFSAARATEATEMIQDRLLAIVRRSRQSGVSTEAAAMLLAQERLAQRVAVDRAGPPAVPSLPRRE